MKILKFTKLRNSMYKLTLEDKSTIKVHEDLILKKNMLLTKEIDDETISNIEVLNNNLSAYDLAIRYISTRYRSVFEVRMYLKNKEIEYDTINDVIKRLIKERYLDDKIYTEAFINDKINFSNDGPFKIRKELENAKVDDNIINEYLEKYDFDLEKDKLEKLIPKYMKTIRNKSYTIMKSKVINHFNDLGYHQSLVNEVLALQEYDDSLSYKTEYEKVKKRLSRKYSGEELEYKIKQSLYQKGYRQ